MGAGKQTKKPKHNNEKTPPLNQENLQLSHQKHYFRI